jgi:uncharacterized protein YndB with AHSA1/START domain
MQTEIKYTWFYPSAPEVVWEHLTKSELIAEWLMKNDFQPILGYKFQFYSNPAPQIDFDGNVYCTVLEIIPNKKLSYSWQCGPGDGKITLDTIVTWTLIAKDNGTELFLHQTGFKEKVNLAIYSAMHDGWLKCIKKIDEQIKAQHGTTKA